MLKCGVTLGAMALAGLMACGGAQQIQTQEPAEVSDQPTAKVARSHTQVVLAQPMEIDLKVKRVGSALNIRINALGRGRLEGEAFEDPTNWTVQVTSGGEPLQRVVNGPVRLGRSPVGKASGNKWDVDLRFSLNYALPKGGGAVAIKVSDPDGVSKTATVHMK